MATTTEAVAEGLPTSPVVVQAAPGKTLRVNFQLPLESQPSLGGLGSPTAAENSHLKTLGATGHPGPTGAPRGGRAGGCCPCAARFRAP
jgi:hypothetical protein